MKVRKLKLKTIIYRLKEVKRVSTMKTADFPDSLKETTRIWRESWITEPLQDIIKKLEHEMNR